MLFIEIITVYYYNHVKHVNAFCWKNVYFFYNDEMVVHEITAVIIKVNKPEPKIEHNYNAD